MNGALQHMWRTKIGDIEVRRVEEMLRPGFDPAFLYPNYDPAILAEHPCSRSRNSSTTQRAA